MKRCVIGTRRRAAGSLNRRLNQKLAAFLENWSEPESFDVAGITPLWNFIRLAEVRRCIDGDMLALKLANGQVQAIEGDRLLSPRTAPRKIEADRALDRGA